MEVICPPHVPEKSSPDTHWAGRLVGPRADVDAVTKKTTHVLAGNLTPVSSPWPNQNSKFSR